jgi:hypothetical protein
MMALREEPSLRPGRAWGVLSSGSASVAVSSESVSESEEEEMLSDSERASAAEVLVELDDGRAVPGLVGYPYLAFRIAAIAGDHRACIERSKSGGKTSLRVMTGMDIRSTVLVEFLALGRKETYERIIRKKERWNLF